MKDQLDLLTLSITILIVALLFCYLGNKNNSIEQMTCIFDKENEERLRKSYLWDQDYEDNFDFKISKEKNVSEKDMNKLKNILKNKSTFKQDNKKINEIFDEHKKVVFYIEEMIDFLLLDNSKEYKQKIDENNDGEIVYRRTLSDCSY